MSISPIEQRLYERVVGSQTVDEEALRLFMIIYSAYGANDMQECANCRNYMDSSCYLYIGSATKKGAHDWCVDWKG